MFCRYSVFQMKDMIPSLTQKTVFFNQKQIFGFSKTKSSKMWMQEHVTDEYVKKAQKDNYRSRASYKLIEIQERYKIFKQGQKVLELGSAPGGWTQVAVEFTKSNEKKPTVLAIDRDFMDPVQGAVFYQGDINDKKTQVYIPEFFKLEPVDIVISDMAPNFSGDLDQDHLLIQDLNNMTIDVCTKNLKIGGTVVMKTLNGTLEKDVFRMYKIYFKEFLRVKPRASRARSSELYYLGKGYGLSKEYEQLKKIEEKREKGIPIDDDDIPDLGFTDQELLEQTRSVILQMYDQGKTLTEEQIKEFKEIPGLNIDWNNLKPKTEEEIEKRKATYNKVKRYNDYRKYYGSKLTFTKNKPTSMAELATQLAEAPTIDMKKAMDQGMLLEDLNKIIKQQNADPIEDEGLFLSDEEEYDPYADDDERLKVTEEFNRSVDQYVQDSKEADPYDAQNLYSPDDQPRTLQDVKKKQLNLQEILEYEKLKEGKKDYYEKLESGEADLEELDQEELEEAIEELEEDIDDQEMEKTNSDQDFIITRSRDNKYQDDHLKADDLDDIIFNKKKK
ncbi:ribosomal RNA large subunit methyltransferase (macronuclear) [Tetrahymena thermophila SB210]|uniref:rRNA methyltransferase 2, mitochondrial n=1 Tax=Tetrahymena thermophila (strain SB210) TaxID=312017 RepID=I7M3R1_TETTS|nr:ribosomal RNA large subunit methyltransferase [Tetrahymena thermophila SB210]EAS03933.3 ribosomal RNA large subunit methyltransferase [Tetrahymena thermophila SB210]|eukprot:XP_001024178.3 ribosomal RNA large subunit methyltransferase [Tetrahymena thermophila SB210]